MFMLELFMLQDSISYR